MKIAILGVGTVGSGVLEVLEQNASIIAARAGESITPVAALVRDKSKAKENVKHLKVYDDFDELIENDEIDVFVELIGGVDLPYKMIKKLLSKGKAVVTANKALLAYHKSPTRRPCCKSHK